MILMSVPLSNRCVAKLCRSEWAVTGLPMRACRREKTHDLLRAQDRRKLLWFLAGDDPLERLLLTERDAVEEAQCARHLIDVRPRVLLVDEFELVGTDILHPQPVRWTIEMPTEL